jgi:hypothetical protein
MSTIQHDHQTTPPSTAHREGIEGGAVGFSDPFARLQSTCQRARNAARRLDARIALEQPEVPRPRRLRGHLVDVQPVPLPELLARRTVLAAYAAAASQQLEYLLRENS